MLVIALLLMVPLGLRYLTAWHMGRLRLRLQRGDDDLRQLHERFSHVRTDLVDTRRQLRQYEVRQRFLAGDLRAERQRQRTLRQERRDTRLAA